MDYGEVLSRAWKIIWRFKILWLFGILAGCGSSSVPSGPNLNYSFNENDIPLQIEHFVNRFTPAQWVALAVVFGIAIVFLVILATFLTIVGRAGLIHGTRKADSGAERLGFGQLFQESLSYFWRILGLILLFMAVVFVVTLISTGLLIFGAVVTLGMLLVCLLPLMCLIIPLVFFISIVLEQSTIAIVVDNLGVLDGLQRGWDVTRHHLGPMVLMGLTLYVGVSGIGGLILALPLMLALAPMIYGIFANSSQSWYTSLAISGLCMVAYLPVLIVVGGILKSYVTSAWTLTYLRLTSR